MGLTQEQVKSLPKYTAIRVRHLGAKRSQLAVTTEVAHDVQGWTLLPFAYAVSYTDSDNFTLKSGSHVAIIGGAYPDEVTLVDEQPEPTTSTGKTEAAIRSKGGIFVGRHGERFVTTETMDVMRRQYGTSTFGRTLVQVAQAIIDEAASHPVAPRTPTRSRPRTSRSARSFGTPTVGFAGSEQVESSSKRLVNGEWVSDVTFRLSGSETR